MRIIKSMLKIEMIPIDKIQPNPFQPRESFDKEKLMELAESIKEVNILQPVILRPNGNGTYQIISGARRWRASQFAGLKKIPAIVKDIDNRQLLIESLIENLHREDLNDFEKAKAIKAIMKKSKIKNKRELAKKLGIRETTITQYLSILSIEKEVKSVSEPGSVGMKVLRSVARVPYKRVRKKLLKKAVKGELSSIEIEKIVPIIRDEKTPEPIKEAVVEKILDPDTAKELTIIGDEKLHKRVIKKLERQKQLKERIIKEVGAAEERSQKMQPKFFRLKELLKEGLILSSIWDIGKRENYAGDPSFHGNSPTQVVEQCILRLTKENELIVDPMVGSGTTIDVCRELNRKCVAFDIKPVRDDIIKNDSKKIPLDDNSADLVFIHPPYWDLIQYSMDPNDLSRSPSFEEFLDSMKKVLKECKRILKPHKYLCILIGDMIKKGEFIPISRKIANIAEEIGLKDRGFAVKLTSGSVSQIVRGKAIYAELAYTDNLKINHDLVMFWQKA